MKRRNISCILLGLAIMLLTVSACVEPIQRPLPDGNDDLYSISFRILTEDDALRTKAGEGGPLSGNDVLVDSLFMYCFDANGRYLGRFQAVDLTSAYENPTAGQQSKPEPDGNTQPAGTFNGEIPPATARIHFVANADCPVGNDKIGMTEEQVMHSPGLVYRSKGLDMSYWGYLRRATPGELAALFSGTTTETVLLVRDRLWIEAGDYDTNVFENDISWVVYNGLNNGYIASYSLPEGASVVDPSNPYQELRYTRTENPASFTLSTVVTPYPESGGRFATTESNMVPFDKNVTGYKPMYVFDDACPVSIPLQVTKIIIKATYKTGTHSTRYFPICITHGYASEPISLMRGHRYELDLRTLPEASGYGTFAEAAASRTFANGALVDIPDQVIEVSDGQFDMRVNYPMVYPLSGETYSSTAILIQNTSASSLEVPFEIKKQSSGVADKTFYFNESAWLEGDSSIPQAHTDAAVTWGTGISTDASNNKVADIGSPLNSTITLPLATVGSTLKQSTYNLKGYYIAPVSTSVPQEVHHILMRNIDVFTIDRFLIQEAYTTASENHNAAGNLVLYSTGAGTYRLKFKLPGGTDAQGDHDKYPELLYPLQVKIASRTLQPTDIYINEVKQDGAVFGVQVRTTEPGVAPAQLAAQNTATQWNYQETNNYWNFWYTYPIISVPRDTDGKEVIGPEVWIDLKDMRNSSSFSTIPTNVGLYLYIEYFGAANAVSLNQARVAATSVTLNPTGTVNVNRGETRQLTATVNPATATFRTVTWSSSNTAVATVDANGLVTVPANATYYSTATITATCADGNRTATVTIRAM